MPADWERRQRLRMPKYAASAAGGGAGKDSCGGFIIRTKPISPGNTCDGKKGETGASLKKGDAGGAQSIAAAVHTSGVSKAVGAEGRPGASSCPYVVVPASSRDPSLTWAASCTPPTPAPPHSRPQHGKCSVVWEGVSFTQINICPSIVIYKYSQVHASLNRSKYTHTGV